MGIVVKTAARAAAAVIVMVGAFVLACLIHEWCRG